MDIAKLYDDFRKGKINRRDFVKILSLGGAVSLFAYVFVLPTADVLQGKYSRWLESNLDAKTDYELGNIQSLFGSFKDNCKFTPGSSHYLFPGKMHPDDKEAAITLGKVSSKGIEQLEFVSGFFNTPDLKGNFICLGSPMSNFLSRVIMQYYTKEVDPSKGLIRENNPIFELEYDYIFDSDYLLSEGLMSKRYVGSKKHAVPNWSMRNISQKELISPSIVGDNLSTDYLLITVLPNIFDKEAYEKGEKVTIFGGTHGVGTKSIELLFKSKKLLSDIKKQIGDTQYWQALVKTDKTFHDTKRKRTAPFSLSDDIKCAHVKINKQLLDIWLSELPKTM